MSELPSTKPSLLRRLRDPQDAEAWSQFVQLYGPLVYQFARRQRFPDADAAELMQEAMRAASRALPWLDEQQRGPFRGWLFGLVHREMCDFLTRRRQEQSSNSSPPAQDELPAPQEDQWNRDYEQHLLAWASEQAQCEFSPAVWQAFWQTAVEGHDPHEVAARLGLSVGEVHLARSRAQARLKQLAQDAGGD